MRILNFTLPIPIQCLPASECEYGEKKMSRSNKSDAGIRRNRLRLSEGRNRVLFAGKQQ